MSSFIDTVKQLGPARMGIMGGILLALLIFFVFVSMRVSSPNLKLLYSDLSSADSSAVAGKLEEVEIPYEISADGSRVLVPDNQVGRARMLLAEAGLPNGGSFGYELFDQQSGFGTTNEVINLTKVRALEGELARTIGSLDHVRSARVHLVLPERELFSRDSRPASASVAINLRPGAQIKQDQILAIQSLIASAVPELKPSNVSVIDQAGTLLARGGSDDAALATAKAEELRRSLEQRLTRNIEDLVSRTVGYGGVRANVTAELNFDRVSTNEELFDPEGQVTRSTQTVEETSVERENSAENISVENNLPGVGSDTFLDPAPSLESARTEETTNNEISRRIVNTVSEGGGIERLSVAVLVDGTYSLNEEGAEVYEPRSEEQLDQIATLVRSAIGFDAARGDTLEVINMQFAKIETTDEIFDNRILGFERSELLDAAEIVTVAIMIILVVLLVIQPMVGRLLAVEESQGDGADPEMDMLTGVPPSPALEGPSDEFDPSVDEEESMIDMQQVEGRVKASAVKKVEDIVESYPQETVSVIRNWMSQE